MRPFFLKLFFIVLNNFFICDTLYCSKFSVQFALQSIELLLCCAFNMKPFLRYILPSVLVVNAKTRVVGHFPIRQSRMVKLLRITEPNIIMLKAQ